MIDDFLAVMGEARCFTTLDVKGGYWQIALREEDKEKTAIWCHIGLYKYSVLPFGLTKDPSILQQLMSVVLHEMGDFAMAYLDDIIIYIPTLEGHTKRIQKAFDHLGYDLKLKLPECKFIKIKHIL